MPDFAQLSHRIEAAFTRIEQEQMRDIPLLNPQLRVQTIGLQQYGERILGVIITPWMMSLILFPAEGEAWSGMTLGEKQTHRLPANEYRFVVNTFDGLGTCQTHSLYSPMHEFMDQDHAVAAAESFMQTLMVEVEHPDTDPHNETLLGRILRGEETPEVEMDGFALAEAKLNAEGGCSAIEGERCLTRRELLRGGF
jgi:[NiFe] hydrogenase assembly HybE family chaperone